MNRSGPILVTGASGRVGGALLRQLEGRAEVRAATRDPVALPHGIRFDFVDPATHAAALEGARAVFLMRPPAIARAAAFEPFLDAMRRAGVRRVVVLSVRGADRVPVLPHHGLERLVMARDLQWTMLRPADFMQNLEDVLRDDIRERDEIAVPAGEGRSPFVDVEDVAAMAACVLLDQGHEGRAYVPTGPASVGFGTVAAALSDALARRVRYRRVSLPRFLLERRRRGTPLSLAAVMGALYTAQRLGLAHGTTDDVPCLLGRPATELAAYVQREREAWSRS